MSRPPRDSSPALILLAAALVVVGTGLVVWSASLGRDGAVILSPVAAREVVRTVIVEKEVTPRPTATPTPYAEPLWFANDVARLNAMATSSAPTPTPTPTSTPPWMSGETRGRSETR